MTLQKAMQSGKPFRRKAGKFWIFIFKDRFYIKEYVKPPKCGTYTMNVVFNFVEGKKGKKFKDAKWTTGTAAQSDSDGSGFQVVMILPSSVIAKDWQIKKAAQ